MKSDTEEIQGNDNERVTERFVLLDLSWGAWRRGQKVEQDHLFDVQTSTTFYRRCAISEELEKHIWHKGQNLREIRKDICITEDLNRYGLT